MNNKLLLTLGAVAVGSLLQVQAQGPNAAIVPNIVLTDIDGVQHNMYDDLDAGKTVYLDFFATWCGPCIGSLPSLDDLWQDHGPDGDNTATIYSLEMDDATSDEAAFQSQYNVPNPIFANGHTLTGWNVSAYPTFIKVCPNRTFKVLVGGLGSGNSGALTGLQVAGCMPATNNTNDALNLGYKGPAALCPGETATLGINMQNYGTSALTSATVAVFENGSQIASTTWSGNLSTYQVAVVNVANVTVNDPSSVELKITNVDDDVTNNDVSVALGATSPGSTTKLELKTDNYGSETGWKLFDSNNNIVQQIATGTYPNTSGGNTYNYTWNLNDSECYRFEITDSYGDGICCAYGQGFYKLKGADNVVFSQGGAFEDDDSRSFSVDVAASVGENTLANALSIYPNPSNGLVNVAFNLTSSERVNIDIYNVLGEVVYNSGRVMAGGAQLEVIDLGSLNNGVYYMNITAGNLTTTRKVTLSK